MDTLLVWKEQLQMFYGKYSSYIDKGLRLILGLLVFGAINLNIGFTKQAASVFVTVGLSVICTFLPLIVMTILAAGLILIHFYSVSLPVVLITAVVFLIMYIFYFRFTPKKAWLILLTPLAFVLKIPYVIPVAFGLVGTPVFAVPVACGSIVYYMLHYVKGASAALKSSGTDSMIKSLSAYTKQIVQNKEMFVAILAFTVCLLLVYNLRMRAADQAWKIAIGAGVISELVLFIAGDLAFGVHIDYLTLILGSAVSVVIGMALEFMIFSVDYSRTQRMQFEDDEYYYYVKAVPKIVVSAPEKTVKKINERQEWSQKETEEELLKQSLNKELGMENNSTKK